MSEQASVIEIQAEEAALNRLWLSHGFGQPPVDHLDMKRQFLNRIGVGDDQIQALVCREIARFEAEAAE